MKFFATKLSTLKEKMKLGLVINNRPILLAYTNKGVFAIRDKCPHMGSPLSSGTLIDGIITCKYHGLPISVETGEVTNVKKAEFLKLDKYSLNVTTYKTIIEKDSIYIDL
ncbi:MAG: Rieske 2Fe-2S domain-containing protein [Candidatus Izemoplasmatales bacterium]|nr:Rieske 2Fe-2S domain-containing protein [Candidatus Izemoplasmatales bacterium]